MAMVGARFDPQVGYVRRIDVRKPSGELRFSPRPARAKRVRKYYRGDWCGSGGGVEGFDFAKRFGETRRSLRRRRPGLWFGILPVAIVLLLTGCGPSGPTPSVDGDELAERVGLAMGSKLTLQALTSDPGRADAAFDAIFAEFDRLDRLLSVWKPESDVVKVNAAAGVSPVAVGPDLIDVLRTARQMSEWTHGKFDVTFGALSDIWKFDQDQDDSVPTAEQIAVRRPLVDYKAIEVDAAAHTVFLRRQGMRMHLGGIGKGYAVEHAVQILRDRGFHNFLIQAGGDMYVAGLKRGRPWRLGIADPRNPTQSFGTLDLSDGTFSTSGDYERAFIRNGVRYHHIIDPETGMPARGCPASRS